MGEASHAPGAWEVAKTLLPWLVAAAASFIAWGFATGRWAERREGGERDLARTVETLERRVQGEHDERKRLVEKINADLGAVKLDLVRVQERIANKIAEAEREHGEFRRDIQELQRQRGAGV